MSELERIRRRVASHQPVLAPSAAAALSMAKVVEEATGVHASGGFGGAVPLATLHGSSPEPAAPLQDAPCDADTLEAAVALVLHEPARGPAELLFIERARRVGDPWSGHMAFPGGRREPADRDLEHTARREVHEEIGLGLGDPLGRLDDFHAERAPILRGRIGARHLRVGAFVYEVPERPHLRLNAEVESTIWVPLDWIVAKASPSEILAGGETTRRVPGFRYGHRLIWGLTYRILRGFYDILGHRLPFEPED